MLVSMLEVAEIQKAVFEQFSVQKRNLLVV